MEGRTLPGKYAILTILVLAVAATAYSQFFYARLQQRPIELWGKFNAQMMLQAPLANAVLLGPVEAKVGAKALQRLMVGGEHFSVLAEKDVTARPGFSHVRQSLVNDTSFDWSAKTGDCKPQWQYGLEFSNGDRTILLLIAPNCGLVQLAETGATGAMQPVMQGLERFMREQFPAD